MIGSLKADTELDKGIARDNWTKWHKGSPAIKKTVKKGDNVTLGGGVTPSPFFLAQIYQGLKLLGNGLCKLTN